MQALIINARRCSARLNVQPVVVKDTLDCQLSLAAWEALYCWLVPEVGENCFDARRGLMVRGNCEVEIGAWLLFPFETRVSQLSVGWND